MKQTALDWLIEQLTAIGVLEIPDGSNAIILTIHQAKELEKQQQGYSIDDLKEAFAMGRTNATIKDFNKQFNNK